MSAPLTLTLPTAALKDALARVGVAVAKKSTLPGLQAVRVTAAVGTDGLPALACYATDLERAVDTPLALENPMAVEVGGVARGEARAFAAPYADLVASVQHAAAETVHLTATPGRVEIVAGRARHKVPALPVGEVVEFAGGQADGAEQPTSDDTPRITAGALLRGVKRVAYAASTEDGEPRLNGVALLPSALSEGHGGAVRLVAMNRHRGADLVLPGLWLAGARDATGPDVASRDVIVHPDSLAAVGAVFDPDDLVTLAVAGQVLTVHAANGRTLRARLTEGPYVPWRQLVKAAKARTVTVDRAGLLAALRRVTHVARATAGGRLRLTLNGDAAGPELELRAETTDRGESVDVVACTDSGASTPPSPFATAVNVAYLTELAAQTFGGPTLTIGADTPAQMLQIADPADPYAVALLAPLRVDA